MSSMNPQATGESTQSEKPQETKAPSSKMPKRVVRITAALCAISLIWAIVTLVQALLAYQKVSSLSSETSDLQSQSASIEQPRPEFSRGVIRSLPHLPVMQARSKTCSNS